MDTQPHHTLTWQGDDGYERMLGARREGWRPVPSWGLRGYNLGHWPLVIVYWRGACELALDIEGDVAVHRCADEEARVRLTDEIAYSSWQDAEASWVEGTSAVDDLPRELRGPCSRRRLLEHNEG